MSTFHLPQTGDIFVWSYSPENKNYSGWHCSATKPGVAWLVSLLEFIVTNNQPFKKAIMLAKPGVQQYSVPNCKSNPLPAEKLILSYSPNQENAWAIISEGSKIHLSFSHETIHSFKRGLQDISEGKGDYSIGGKGQSLWFWWSPNG